MLKVIVVKRMNYGVKKAIAGTRRGFRKAGQALQGFDDAYSAKIRDMYQGANPAVQTAGNMFLGGPSFIA